MIVESNAIYTVDQAAKIMAVSTDTIYRYIRNGKLKCSRIGAKTRILGADILALFKANMVNGDSA